jgi:hypothetical protein
VKGVVSHLQSGGDLVSAHVSSAQILLAFDRQGFVEDSRLFSARHLLLWHDHVIERIYLLESRRFCGMGIVAATLFTKQRPVGARSLGTVRTYVVDLACTGLV